MKIICKVNNGNTHQGFQPEMVVVEVVKNKLIEVDISVTGYSSPKHIEISAGGVSLNPKTLQVSSSSVAASELLLNLEVCKFVMDEHPKLAKNEFS